MKKVAVSGAGGQIAYSFLFRLAAGEVFGNEEPIELKLLEVPQAIESLKGTVMELEDCAFPLLEKVEIEHDAWKVFEGVDLAVLIGAKPRGPGMERKDLLIENGKIFIEQGKALSDVAGKDVRVFVVGNPANTNALIAMEHAEKIGRDRFFAMTGLDHNRAVSMLAQKGGVNVDDVEKMAIWGNHSSTQVVDFTHAELAGKNALELIGRKWCEEEFFPKVQKRGAEVIAARGKSSAASAAQGIISSLQFLYQKREGWFSFGLCSDGNSYGVEGGLIFSFPCRSLGGGNIEVVKGLEWDPFVREKIAITEKELIEERKIAL